MYLPCYFTNRFLKGIFGLRYKYILFVGVYIDYLLFICVKPVSFYIYLLTTSISIKYKLYEWDKILIMYIF